MMILLPATIYLSMTLRKYHDKIMHIYQYDLRERALFIWGGSHDSRSSQSENPMTPPLDMMYCNLRNSFTVDIWCHLAYPWFILPIYIFKLLKLKYTFSRLRFPTKILHPL